MEGVQVVCHKTACHLKTNPLELTRAIPSAGGLLSSVSRLLRRHVVEALCRVEQMVQHQPEAPRMVKEEQRKDDCEGNPESELMVDRHAGESIQDKKAGHGDGHGGGVVDVNGTDKVALLPFELQSTLATVGMHSKRFHVQRPHAATRAAQAQSVADHRQNSRGHLTRSLLRPPFFGGKAATSLRLRSSNRAGSGRCRIACRPR